MGSASGSSDTTLKALYEQAPKWTLAQDSSLFQCLEDISKSITDRAGVSSQLLQSTWEDCQKNSIHLQSCINSFNMLSNVQFMESRVREENFELLKKPKVDDKSDEKSPAESPENKRVTELRQAITLTQTVLQQAFDVVEINLDDSDDEDTAAPSKRTFREPKDPYLRRPLPFVIGTPEFNRDRHIGLRLPTEEPEIAPEDDLILTAKLDDILVAPRNAADRSTPAQIESSSSSSDIVNGRGNNTRISTENEHLRARPLAPPIIPKVAPVIGSGDSEDENDIFATRPIKPNKAKNASVTPSPTPDTFRTTPPPLTRTSSQTSSRSSTVPSSSKQASSIFDDNDDDDGDLFSTKKTRSDTLKPAKSAEPVKPVEPTKLPKPAVATRAKVVPKTSSLFDDDGGDDDDLFAIRKSKPATPLDKSLTGSASSLPDPTERTSENPTKSGPLMSELTKKIGAGASTVKPEIKARREPTAVPPVATAAKQVEKVVAPSRKATLFDDNSDDDDLFAVPKKTDATPEKKDAVPVKSVVEKSDALKPPVKSVEPVKPVEPTSLPKPAVGTRAKVVPKASSLFDDDGDDDDDLFAVRKSKPAAPIDKSLTGSASSLSDPPGAKSENPPGSGPVMSELTKTIGAGALTEKPEIKERREPTVVVPAVVTARQVGKVMAPSKKATLFDDNSDDDDLFAVPKKPAVTNEKKDAVPVKWTVEKSDEKKTAVRDSSSISASDNSARISTGNLSASSNALPRAVTPKITSPVIGGVGLDDENDLFAPRRVKSDTSEKAPVPPSPVPEAVTVTPPPVTPTRSPTSSRGLAIPDAGKLAGSVFADNDDGNEDDDLFGTSILKPAAKTTEQAKPVEPGPTFATLARPSSTKAPHLFADDGDDDVLFAARQSKPVTPVDKSLKSSVSSQNDSPTKNSENSSSPSLAADWPKTVALDSSVTDASSSERSEEPSIERVRPEKPRPQPSSRRGVTASLNVPVTISEVHEEISPVQRDFPGPNPQPEATAVDRPAPPQPAKRSVPVPARRNAVPKPAPQVPPVSEPVAHLEKETLVIHSKETATKESPAIVPSSNIDSKIMLPEMETPKSVETFLVSVDTPATSSQPIDAVKEIDDINLPRVKVQSQDGDSGLSAPSTETSKIQLPVETADPVISPVEPRIRPIPSLPSLPIKAPSADLNDEFHEPVILKKSPESVAATVASPVPVRHTPVELRTIESPLTLPDRIEPDKPEKIVVTDPLAEKSDEKQAIVTNSSTKKVPEPFVVRIPVFALPASDQPLSQVPEPPPLSFSSSVSSSQSSLKKQTGALFDDDDSDEDLFGSSKTRSVTAKPQAKVPNITKTVPRTPMGATGISKSGLFDLRQTPASVDPLMHSADTETSHDSGTARKTAEKPRDPDLFSIKSTAKKPVNPAVFEDDDSQDDQVPVDLFSGPPPLPSMSRNATADSSRSRPPPLFDGDSDDSDDLFRN